MAGAKGFRLMRLVASDWLFLRHDFDGNGVRLHVAP